MTKIQWILILNHLLTKMNYHEKNVNQTKVFTSIKNMGVVLMETR